MAGFRVSETSVKHRNIDPKDARGMNMVVLDVRTAGNNDDCLLGPWERQYLLGVIRRRARKGPNQPDDLLTITIYEPWALVQGLPSMPLWASRKINGTSSTKIPQWVNLLKMPWLPVSQMPMEVHKALIVSSGQSYHKPAKTMILSNYKETGIDVVKMNPPYTNQQKAGTIKYIIQLEKNEKVASDVTGIITLNASTQRDLMNSVFNANTPELVPSPTL